MKRVFPHRACEQRQLAANTGVVAGARVAELAALADTLILSALLLPAANRELTCSIDTCRRSAADTVATGDRAVHQLVAVAQRALQRSSKEAWQRLEQMQLPPNSANQPGLRWSC